MASKTDLRRRMGYGVTHWLTLGTVEGEGRVDLCGYD